MSEPHMNRKQLEREIKPLVEGAQRELVAIATRPFAADIMPMTTPAEAQAALDSMRAEVTARVTEYRRVFDRVIYTVRARYGERAEGEIKRRLDALFETMSARFQRRVETICGKP